MTGLNAARAIACAVLLALCASLAFADPNYEPLDKSGVNPLDRAFMVPYSAGLDITSDVTQYAAFLAPAAFLVAAPSSDYLKVGLLYAGSAGLSLGLSEAGKRLVSRDRPYMYFEGAPEAEIDQGKDDESFPSRHAMMAFTGAAFTATLFALEYPGSRYRVPAVSAAYALAGATAILRVASGSHFVTDVATGALIGSAVGFAVPFIADKAGYFGSAGADRSGLSVSPLGVSYSVAY